MNRNDIIATYKKHILRYTSRIFLPKSPLLLHQFDTNSWFQIQESKQIDSTFKIPTIKVPKNNKLIKCIKVELFFSNEQKSIINKWLEAYIDMYNETLRYIKHTYVTTKKLILDYKKLRTYHLKKTRNKIISNSSILTHVIDTAIKLACANYKSALSNYKRNVKFFRIRYMRHNKISKILEIEPGYFINGKLSKVGKIKARYNNKKFKLTNITKACKLQKLYNRYYLFIPKSIEQLDVDYENDYISLDPGVRTFMSGISENEIILIGDDASLKIKDYHRRIDKAHKIENKNKQNKKITLYRRKIINLIDDLHWKTINYLVQKYDTIFIGNMSAKEIIKCKKNQLRKLTKRVISSFRFYKFKQRLEYKCLIYKRGFKEIDESYTSKMCSNCGWLNEKLGGSKIFNCKECKIRIDRDVNGSRGILIKTKI